MGTNRNLMKCKFLINYIILKNKDEKLKETLQDLQDTFGEIFCYNYWSEESEYSDSSSEYSNEDKEEND